MQIEKSSAALVLRLCFAIGALMSAPEGLSAAPNLVVNGSFETGDLTGWSSSFTGVGITTSHVESGTYAADFSGVAGQEYGIGQVVTGLVPGQTYVFDLWLEAIGTAHDNSDEWDLHLNAGSNLLETSSNFLVIMQDFPYRDIREDIVTNATSLSIQISGFGDGTGNYYADNISLVELVAPEPSSIVLLIMGAAGLLSFARARKAKRT